MASAAEELASSIREIGTQMQQSTAVVTAAVAAGAEARASIEALNEQVAQIGSVAEMIGEIAGRTNLLALNATIEAARAGEAGKGFAVVASEVKALASQTARSTHEISQRIGEIRSATGASVSAVTRISDTIGRMDAIAASIAAAIEQQSAATAEIARNVNETSQAAHQMTNRTAEVSTEAEQTGGHAAMVLESTAALAGDVQRLRRSVIRAVRTATTEVDRRKMPRYPIDVPCRLSVGGQIHAVRLRDIGEGGAAVAGAPALPTGARGSLSLDSVELPLAFASRGHDGDRLHVAFELDRAAKERLEPLLARLAQAQAA